MPLPVDGSDELFRTPGPVVDGQCTLQYYKKDDAVRQQFLPVWQTIYMLLIYNVIASGFTGVIFIRASSCFKGFKMQVNDSQYGEMNSGEFTGLCVKI